MSPYLTSLPRRELQEAVVCNCLDTRPVQAQAGSCAGSERWAQHTRERRRRSGRCLGLFVAQQVGRVSAEAIHQWQRCCPQHSAADGRGCVPKHQQGGRQSLPAPLPAGSCSVCFAVLRLLLTDSAEQSITAAFLLILLPRAFCGT